MRHAGPSPGASRNGVEDGRRPPGAALAPGPGLPADDPDPVARTLTVFVNTSIMARARPVRPDDNLEAAGVDSMGLLRLLLFVEAEYGFWMPDEDLVEVNLASTRALADYICRRRAGV